MVILLTDDSDEFLLILLEPELLRPARARDCLLPQRLLPAATPRGRPAQRYSKIKSQ